MSDSSDHHEQDRADDHHHHHQHHRRSKIEPASLQVHLNDAEKNAAFHYPDNFIRTSKYTLFTFLPLNLYEQFRKASNAYFFLAMCISLIPGASAINPLTAVMPLLFVLAVSAGKDGYEDFKRHRNDERANRTMCTVVRGGIPYPVPSKDVHVGDVLYIENGEEIRADCILLSSSLPEGIAYIDTAQLDGETNVKSRKAQDESTYARFLSPDAFKVAELNIIQGLPHESLVQWQGVQHCEGTTVPLGIDQFLYRGAFIRNTEWVYGVVVYAGIHTKMMMNLKQKPPKFSYMDQRLNYFILVVIGLKHILLFFLCAMSVYWNDHSDNQYAWYLGDFIDFAHGVALFWWSYLSYFILLSYMIPISLFVSLELCKAMQVQLMSWDLAMVHITQNGIVQTCRPKTSNLNEQLSQVQYVFTDKTGTLTENIMNYVKGTINGVGHDDRLQHGGLRQGLAGVPHGDVRRYLCSMALCHAVVPVHNKHGVLVYEGQSPDEVALVNAARTNGVVLLSRTNHSMEVDVLGTKETWGILAQLDFTPERKMMSVVLKSPDDNIVMFTKGADTSVMPRLNSAVSKELVTTTDAALIADAQEGLRTLVIGAKAMAYDEFQKWKIDYDAALCDMEDRKGRVHEACLELEHSLHLVGTTAIEDKLQDGVPETIRFLLDAKIIVWMLTGDKRETAVNIAGTSGLIRPQDDVVVHVDMHDNTVGVKSESERVRLQLEDAMGAIEHGRRVCVVVDGESLRLVFEHHDQLFLDMCEKLTSAVCCRLAPKQKADVVRRFQTGSRTALAIGDGANDVSMIQEGRVGIGIMGLEGSQAELASDYAIPRFRHLKRLLFVHGRYALYRNATMISYSFYKNVCIAFCLLFWSTESAYSGETFFDSWLLVVINAFFSFVAPLVLAMFDKDLPESALEEDATLYTPLREGLYFDAHTARLWTADTIYHMILLYWLAYPAMAQDSYDAKSMGLKEHALVVYTGLMIVINLRWCLVVRYWTGIMVFGVVIGLLLYAIFILIYTSIPVLFGDGSFYGVVEHMCVTALFWAFCGMYFGAVVMFDVGGQVVQRWWWPTRRDLAQVNVSQRHMNGGSRRGSHRHDGVADSMMKDVNGDFVMQGHSVASAVSL
eukprot:PhM_4_TR13946/c0_g1_i1/m.5262/K14802/DRS2, ATP8A; phospholipid-transporting ATPase